MLGLVFLSVTLVPLNSSHKQPQDETLYTRMLDNHRKLNKRVHRFLENRFS